MTTGGGVGMLKVGVLKSGSYPHGPGLSVRECDAPGEDGGVSIAVAASGATTTDAPRSAVVTRVEVKTPHADDDFL